MKRLTFRILIVLMIVASVLAFMTLGLGQYMTIETLKAQQEALKVYYDGHMGLMIGAYFVIYVFSTALSLPGAAILTLAGGAIFGFWPGTLIVSFASTIGATLAFIVSRFLLRDWVQGRFREKLTTINEGIRKEGAFYLFALRLVPAFPFFLVNLVMGLTPIKTTTFYWVSQTGMLAGTMAFVFAGTQLSQIQSVRGILSLKLMISFTIIGVLPLISRAVIGHLRSGKWFRRYNKGN